MSTNQKFFATRTLARQYAKDNNLIVRDSQSHEAGKRWYVYIVGEEQKPLKMSELLIKAKGILRTEKEEWNSDTFICHSIQKADGSYANIKKPSANCAKAVEIVEHFCKNIEDNQVKTYVQFHVNLFGLGNDITFKQMQAGRHRLLDFLIAEYQANGE